MCNRLLHKATHKQRKSDEMTRQELFTWVRQQYGTEPEYPWHDRNAVLRHNDNNKWYGVVLEVSADKLGLPEAGIINVSQCETSSLSIRISAATILASYSSKAGHVLIHVRIRCAAYFHPDCYSGK